MRPLILCGILLIPITLHAQPKWHVEEGSVTFEITNAGLPVRGSFEGLEADVRFDPAQPERGRIVASVDASTVASGIGLRDRHLRKHDYFDVERHPRIHMESLHIERADGDTLRGRFRLRIKEVTREVAMPFTFDHDGRTGRLEGRFRLNRLDFGLGEPSVILSDTVTVRLVVLMVDPEQLPRRQP